MKINKTACFTVAFLAALSSVLFVNQAAITRQLDDWQVLPRPDRFSELYFTNERQLPSVVKVGSAQKLTFTVHNLEYQTTNYRYKVVAASNIDGAEQLLGEGTLTLEHDQSQIAEPTVSIPAIGTHVALKVKVEYEGIVLGEKQPTPQTQSIFFWTKAEGSLGMNQGGIKRDA